MRNHGSTKRSRSIAATFAAECDIFIGRNTSYRPVLIYINSKALLFD